MIENTMKMIRRILVRLAAFRSSVDSTGFLFDFLFAISYLTHLTQSFFFATEFTEKIREKN